MSTQSSLDPYKVKISSDVLAKINEFRAAAISHDNDAVKSQIKSASATDSMRLLIAEAITELGLSVSASILCTNCGTVRADSKPPRGCSSCGKS